MFVILDTNHFTELVAESAFGLRLSERLVEMEAIPFVTIITAQEVCQGWCAFINRQSAGRSQVFGYGEFQHSFDMLSNLVVLAFDSDAATAFHELKNTGIRIGSMDLKISAIALSHDALLLSRNLVDFEKVPGLRVQNWLD